MKKTFAKESLFSGKTKKIKTKELGTVIISELKAGVLLKIEELKGNKTPEEVQNNSALSQQIGLMILAGSISLENGETFTVEELLQLPMSILMELFGLVNEIAILSGIDIEAKNNLGNANPSTLNSPKN